MNSTREEELGMENLFSSTVMAIIITVQEIFHPQLFFPCAVHPKMCEICNFYPNKNLYVDNPFIPYFM